MARPAKQSEIYGNCKVCAPDGTVMCRCSQDKINWYLSRGLAEITDTDPLTIRLNFEPSGRGHAGMAYYLHDKRNMCVVCGRTDTLSRHHVVPYLYRRHLPVEYRRHCSHDIVPLCSDCHSKYELLAERRKKEIAEEHGVLHLGYSRPDRDLVRIRSWARALCVHAAKIPEARRAEMWATIEKHLGRPPTAQDAEMLSVMSVFKHEPGEYTSHDYERNEGKKVVEKLLEPDGTVGPALKNLIRDWRRHFLETMQPKYMPTEWSVDHLL
jgi:hypothetical protein